MARTPTVEHRSIDVIPRSERHGSPTNQFTLWLGANLQITAIVDGALAVVFGADALWAIIGLLVGNVLGGVVMALHSAQGPRLGLPQTISSRAQFGVFGAVVPLLLVILMYLGFTATRRCPTCSWRGRASRSVPSHPSVGGGERADRPTDAALV